MQAAVRRRHPVLVAEDPVAADPVGLLVAVECDAPLVQRLGGGDAGRARADDGGGRERLTWPQPSRKLTRRQLCRRVHIPGAVRSVRGVGCRPMSSPLARAALAAAALACSCPRAPRRRPPTSPRPRSTSSLRASSARARARRRRPPGEDVRRADAEVRRGHRRRPPARLQVREVRHRRGSARARSRRSRAAASGSCATASTCRTSRPDATALTWAAGWVMAEDRGLLLEEARYNSRLAAIDAPNLTAVPLIAAVRPFVPSAQTETEVARQTRASAGGRQARRAPAARHRRLPAGINAQLRAAKCPAKPWTRTDVYASTHSRASSSARAAATRPGAPVPRRSAAAPRRPPSGQTSSTTCASATPPTIRPRSTAPSPTRPCRQTRAGTYRRPRLLRAAVRPGGGTAPAASRRSRAAPTTACAAKHPHVSRPPLDERPPAVRRRPADRLLLPRPHARDGHARAGRRRARGDLGPVPGLHAHRARPRLRLDADVRGRRHHRPVRRDALRRRRRRTTSSRASAAP